MAITFATESITVSRPIGQGETGSTTTRTVDIQPMTSQAAYEQYGVEMGNGFLLFDESSAGGLYQEHGRITWGGLELAIKAVPRVWDALTPASHVAVLLEEIR
jgi:hypothetical protein